MKRIVLLISIAAMTLLNCGRVSAQGKFGPDSAECIKYLSYYLDGSPPGSPVPGILQARTLEWVAISFSNA